MYERDPARSTRVVGRPNPAGFCERRSEDFAALDRELSSCVVTEKCARTIRVTLHPCLRYPAGDAVGLGTPNPSGPLRIFLVDSEPSTLVRGERLWVSALIIVGNGVSLTHASVGLTFIRFPKSQGAIRPYVRVVVTQIKSSIGWSAPQELIHVV